MQFLVSHPAQSTGFKRTVPSRDFMSAPRVQPFTHEADSQWRQYTGAMMPPTVRVMLMRGWPCTKRQADSQDSQPMQRE